jgi:acid phosphatase (class A)
MSKRADFSTENAETRQSEGVAFVARNADALSDLRLAWGDAAVEHRTGKLDAFYDAAANSPPRDVKPPTELTMPAARLKQLRAILDAGAVRPVAYDAELAAGHAIAREAGERVIAENPAAADDAFDAYRWSLGHEVDIPGQPVFRGTALSGDRGLTLFEPEMLAVCRKQLLDADAQTSPCDQLQEIYGALNLNDQARFVRDVAAQSAGEPEVSKEMARWEAFQNPNPQVPLDKVAETLTQAEAARDTLIRAWARKGYYAGYSYYVDPAEIDLQRKLPAPPAEGSQAHRVDLGVVREAQRNRTSDQIADAKLDAEMSVFRFADVLGPNFIRENLPFAGPFLHQAFIDGDNGVAGVKSHYARRRPFMVDPRIETIVEQPPNASYPSGHSTFGHVNARLLARMLPEKAADIFDRAARYADYRVVAGVHFPTDLQAGSASAGQIEQALFADPMFVKDFDRARTEVRAALGLELMPEVRDKAKAEI